jgi:hypothetical protein
MGATTDQIVDWSPAAIYYNQLSCNGCEMPLPETDESLRFLKNGSRMGVYNDELTPCDEMLAEGLDHLNKFSSPDQLYSEPFGQNELKEGRMLVGDTIRTATSTDALDHPAIGRFNEAQEATSIEAQPTFAPIKRGKKGLCYDVDQLVDNRVRERILRNRESAERSRKRKIDSSRETLRLLEDAADLHRALSVANSALHRRLADIQAELLALQ